MAETEILRIETAREASRAMVPLLETGDHLTRDEFERRYDAMPEVKKAELLEGIVFMGSPVRLGRHGRPHVAVSTWLGTYQARTPGVIAGDNVSIRLDDESMPQPDLCMIIDPDLGGQTSLSEEDYIVGGPELVVEIAASTVSIDMNTKLRIYCRNNVREYVVWRVVDRIIDWFILREGDYQKLPIGDDGLYRSEVFPGLWLDPRAIIASDLERVLDALGQGVADPSHAHFVDRLNPRTGRA